MESIIDYIVSTTWVFLTVTMLALAVSGTFLFMKPTRILWLNIVVGIVFGALFVYIMIFATRGPFGYAVEFTEAHSNGKQLALEERHEVGDGDGGTTTVYRLYVLDLKTGERLLRTTTDYSDVVSVTNDAFIINGREEITKYNLLTGEEMHTWTLEKGFEKFPELKSGISSISRDHRTVDGKTKGYITITALNGREYYLDPVTEVLAEGRPPHVSDRDEYRFSFQTKTGQIKNLVRNYPEELVLDRDLLEPEVVHFDKEKSILIFEHYTTLNKDKTIITALDHDLKQLWEHTEDELQLADKYDENPAIGTSIVVGNNLIITFGGWVICFDLNTGEIRWKNRL